MSNFQEEFTNEAMNNFEELYKSNKFVSYESINKIIKSYKERYEEAYEGEAWGQSWRVWKGALFENLITKLLELCLQNTNVGITNDKEIDAAQTTLLENLKKQILIEYKCGEALPDAAMESFIREKGYRKNGTQCICSASNKECGDQPFWHWNTLQYLRRKTNVDGIEMQDLFNMRQNARQFSKLEFKKKEICLK